MDFSLSKEQRDIVRAAKKFARAEFPDRALEFDREETFDLDLWRKACELGFVGVFIGEAYGGAGLGFFEHSLISEEFWAVDPGIGQAILSTTFGSELLLLYGTEEQKQSILPRLVSGKAVMGTAITEPNAGSDVAGAMTSAAKDGQEWVINGSKMFTTNGTIADFILLFCRTDPDNPSRHGRHSFILVPTDTAGFKAKKIRGKMGIRASDTAELSLTDVRVPLDNLVGKEGEGFRQLMAFFNRTRPHVSAQAVGLARAALEEALRHTKERRQFGRPLASFQVTQFKLAEMATWIRAARNLYYEAAWSVDQGKVDHALIAMAKWFSAETAVRCVDEALQLHGGYGYIDEYRINRLYRAAKILEIYEGTKEMEKTIISRSLIGSI
ncbi:MAG: acyl-CoA dehydrogenase family protein [Deltaproteobacteria bacterium]|nr:acyl-CoA dehydrogenase family protein [Deltaproteobacteria bacterium]MBW2015239.1 acyl-CoA dehydrogenase family protein [Deltaproteobacteria bacterium]MBW2128520.1 acyl-CoA dehydrogenase family protein [Deltaproteobacteria bacterium]MBW2302360.1 acyl-CoA dehydrogenase family protein [Deltaproteobacteria bacterium]